VLDLILKSAGPFTAAFVAVGVNDFRTAAAYLNRIRYGRAANSDDVSGVIREHRRDYPEIESKAPER